MYYKIVFLLMLLFSISQFQGCAWSGLSSVGSRCYLCLIIPVKEKDLLFEIVGSLDLDSPISAQVSNALKENKLDLSIEQELLRFLSVGVFEFENQLECIKVEALELREIINEGSFANLIFKSDRTIIDYSICENLENFIGKQPYIKKNCLFQATLNSSACQLKISTTVVVEYLFSHPKTINFGARVAIRLVDNRFGSQIMTSLDQPINGEVIALKSTSHFRKIKQKIRTSIQAAYQRYFEQSNSNVKIRSKS